jgi:hypothetical protein
MRCVFPGLVLPKCASAGEPECVVIYPNRLITKRLALFLFFRRQYFQFKPGKSRAYRGRALHHFGSTKPGKSHAYRGRALHTHAGPILPFFIFIFPGTVLPFFYFSVVRKVPEKPVLFLPHPLYSTLLSLEARKKFCE